MSRITRVELARFDYEVVQQFKFLKPDEDGIARRPSVLVRLSDEDGYEGWGQAVPVPSWSYETAETVESTLRGYLGAALIGLDPADLNGVHARMNETIRPAFSTGQPFCKAAIDIACHDLLAKREGIRLVDLLGGAGAESLQLSWTVAAGSPQEVEDQLTLGLQRGYQNFNIKVGGTQTAAFDLELAATVRSANTDGFLWADANTGYTLERALELAPRLADLGVDVLESPLPPNQLRGYQTLRAQGALPILMDEGIVSPQELDEFISLGMMDGAVLKPARNAGIWPSIRIVELLSKHGLLILGSGLTELDVALAASAHLYAWACIDHPCALNGPQFLTSGIDRQEPAVREDVLPLPTRPGLGVEPDSSIVEALREVAAAPRSKR